MPRASALQRELQEQLDTLLLRHRLPGAAVGVVVGDREVVATSGVTSVEDPLPVTDQTLFMVGSTTKTFTATALMRLVEQGRCSLDDRVLDHLPEFRLGDRAATRALTLRHLVTHTGGWDGDIDSDTGWGDDALDRYVRALRQQPQQFAPGAVWAYNNAGFSVAGRVIEVLAGSTYEQAVTDLLLRPLGMDHSFFFPVEAATRRFAAGHMSNGRGAPTLVHTWGLPRALAPAGGLVSSVRDQVRWARFHLGDGRVPGGTARLLRARTMRLMQSDLAAAGVLADTVGVSWLIKDIGVRTVAHGGNVGNLQLSTFLMVPERGFAVTVLTNATSGRPVSEAVERWALQRCLGVAEPAPVWVDPGSNGIAPDEYAGSYASRMSRLEVVPRGAGLQLTSHWSVDIDQVDESEREMVRKLLAARPRPISLGFTARDRVAVRGAHGAGLRAEFLRESPGGPVRWLRWGGRVHLRTESPPARPAPARRAGTASAPRPARGRRDAGRERSR